MANLYIMQANGLLNAFYRLSDIAREFAVAYSVLGVSDFIDYLNDTSVYVFEVTEDSVDKCPRETLSFDLRDGFGYLDGEDRITVDGGWNFERCSGLTKNDVEHQINYYFRQFRKVGGSP